MKKKVAQQLQDVPHVYTQWTPFVVSVVEELLKGKLKEVEYLGGPNIKKEEKIGGVFIYIVGGVTFSEANAVVGLRKKYPETSFYLGGTHLLNTAGFIGESFNLTKGHRSFEA